MSRAQPTKSLNWSSTLVIALISLALSFAWDRYVDAEHGNIAFCSSLLVLVAVYSAWPVRMQPRIVVFLAAYAAIHVAICFLPWPNDGAYFSIILLPIAIADYAGTIFAIWHLAGNIRTEAD